MGQSLSLDSIISSLDYNSEEFIEAEEIVGPCAFDKLFLKSVPHILERIFLSLDYYSYNNCLSVNHRWKELLSSDSFERKWKVMFCQEILDREKRLHYASKHGHLREVKRLISYLMVDVNCEMGRQKTTPLHEAVRGGHRDVLGRIGFSRKCGDTPLHYAAANGNPDIVNMLLDGGAEPNKADIYGDTPLHLAAWYGHRDLVVSLLDRGAAPNMEDECGDTPLSLVREHICRCSEHSGVIKILQPYEV